MPSPFDAQLVNGPFGDPALFVDVVHGRRAILVDAGDLTVLAPRKLLRITDILISHTHMDHWSGFDRFLRLALGRDRTVRLFGPLGMAERVEHKLRAYTWNLLERYTNELAFEVTEIGEQGASTRTAFRLCDGFAREALAPVSGGPVVVEDAHLRVTATTLDHGIPCLAFAIEERVHVNVWKTRLAELGLGTGPWLAELKSLVAAGAADDATVQARWREGGRLRTESFALGFLRDRVLRVVPGRKLAYVTDAAWTASNMERIVELASGAEILFIEAPFLDRDWERAAARHHLTARQAGSLARRAGVKRVVPFHFSPRHAHEEVALRGEMEAAFGGGQGTLAPRGCAGNIGTTQAARSGS